MYCPKCGTHLAEESQFCNKCGQAQVARVATTSSGAAVAPAPIAVSPKPKGTFTPWFWWMMLAIAVIVVVTVVVNRANEQAAEQARLRAPRQYTAALPKSSFSVGANSFNSYKFTVPDGAYNVRFEGDFNASGGVGNDINVFLATEDDFVNWQNRHPVKVIYGSGKETQGTIKVGLPSGAGIYELVFNNRFSLFTGKDIEAHGTLSYTKVPDQSELPH